MELKQIKELMVAMERSGIKKLSIKEKSGFEIHLEKHSDSSNQPVTASSHYAPLNSHLQKEMESHSRSPAVPNNLPRSEEQYVKSSKEDAKEGKYVTSPMVGTFYATPAPEDPPFVKVGERVDENTVVCIIEAMKVMNEVKAGISGIIAEVCIENADPVEFGTKIFRIV